MDFGSPSICTKDTKYSIDSSSRLERVLDVGCGSRQIGFGLGILGLRDLMEVLIPEFDDTQFFDPFLDIGAFAQILKFRLSENALDVGEVFFGLSFTVIFQF